MHPAKFSFLEEELRKRAIESGRGNLYAFITENKLIPGHPSDSQWSAIENILETLQSRFFSRDAQTYYLKSKALFEQKLYADSLALIQQSLNIENDNWSSLDLKGQLEKTLDRMDSFEETIKKSISLIPFHLRKTEQLVELLIIRGKYKEIIDLFKINILRSSDKLDSYYGFALTETGEHQKALSVFLKLAKKYQDASLPKSTAYGVGINLFKLGSHELATSYLEKFVRLAKNDFSQDTDLMNLNEKVALAIQMIHHRNKNE